MDKVIKFLKIILLTISILIGLGLLAGIFFIYKGVKSGNLGGFVAKTAVETLAPDANLSDVQKQMLEEGNYEGLAEDIEENITEEQIECAVEVLGPVRAAELQVTMEPTPQEVLKLSKCL